MEGAMKTREGSAQVAEASSSVVASQLLQLWRPMGCAELQPGQSRLWWPGRYIPAMPSQLTPLSASLLLSVWAGLGFPSEEEVTNAFGHHPT